MKVLIASRHAIIREALRHLLSSAGGVEVMGEAETLEEAAQAIQRLHPSVVLIETVEPACPDLMPFLRNHASDSSRVVVLANYAEPNLVRELFRAGLAGCVLKVSSHVDLLLALRSAECGRKFLDSRLIETVVLEDPPSPTKPSKREELSKRQMQVLRSIVMGQTSGEIAQALGVSVKTVETYRSRIYQKLELHSRADLMQYAASRGMVSFSELAGAPRPGRPEYGTGAAAGRE